MLKRKCCAEIWNPSRTLVLELQMTMERGLKTMLMLIGDSSLNSHRFITDLRILKKRQIPVSQCRINDNCGHNPVAHIAAMRLGFLLRPYQSMCV